MAPTSRHGHCRNANATAHFFMKTLKFCSPIDCVNDQTCAGIDGIITNKPKQLAKLLKSRFWINETREKNT